MKKSCKASNTEKKCYYYIKQVKNKTKKKIP